MDNEIFSKEVDALYRALPVPLIAIFFNTLIIAYILADHVSYGSLTFWIAANMVLIFARLAAYFYFRSSITPDSTYHPYVAYMAGVIASGLLWGSSAYFLLPDSSDHTMMLIIIIGGMVAGAVGSSSYRPESYLFYNLLVTSPYALHFILQRTDTSWMIGITLLLFSVMMIISSKRFHANFSEVVLLQLQQQELLKHLEEEKLYADHLNDNLLQEIIQKEQYQDDLLNALDEARQAAVAKDAFFATMSHELRTPLNAIIGFSQLLIRRPDISKEVSSYTEKILFAGRHLLDLVNTILDFSKMKAGKMELSVSQFTLSELFKEVSAIIEPLGHKRSLRIVYPSVKDEILTADRKMIQQVFINLLSNAVKFSPEGESVTITYTNDGHHQFSVCDHGYGIAPENLDAIFDPFTQGEPSPEAIKGTGLGLAIVKEMVHAHGGTIWVESEIGKGSCFYVTLPKIIDSPHRSE
ncbi:MAG: HAMP domain-containing sensor histidine kinase [Sulfuricurvum sp.]|uniref:sensor histidine kinase n=1 Tax=Sulfuricurvum sp. TaxID=2025608 RepID=UPI003561D458